MAKTIKIDCPAKVNLALSVGAPISSPRGFLHPIASWMLAVDFADELSLASVADNQSRYDLSFSPHAPLAQKVDWPLERDLVYRAHKLMESHVGRSLPAQIRLRKRIPAGAGLGGGSSDAAGMLVGLNDFFDLRLDAAALQGLAVQLGSDVAFIIGVMTMGMSSAIVTGLGEQLEPATITQPLRLVLIFPPLDCPTGAVYQAFDKLNLPANISDRPQTERVRQLTRMATLPPDGPFNDLAEPAFAVRPMLRNYRDQLSRILRWPIHITGSGAAMFLVLGDESSAQSMAQRATKETGLPAVATKVR